MEEKPKLITESNIKGMIGCYKLEHTIGSGTFGKVKLGVNTITGEKVAIKLLEKEKISDKDELERIMREMKYLKSLNHPNIIKVYEVRIFVIKILESERSYYIVMEYASGGELFHYIVRKKRLIESEVNLFFFQIINGLEYMHKSNVVHRDLKPENLLLKEESGRLLKIIDFGLSNDVVEGNQLVTPCGSPCYAAPEMVQGKKYSGVKVDIWSAGVTLYAMTCGYLPFEDKHNENLYKKIIECKVEYPHFIPFAHKDLIKRILVANPIDRITLEEIKKHPVYTNGKIGFIREYKNLSQEFSINVDNIVNKENNTDSDGSRVCNTPKSIMRRYIRTAKMEGISLCENLNIHKRGNSVQTQSKGNTQIIKENHSKNLSIDTNRDLHIQRIALSPKTQAIKSKTITNNKFEKIDMPEEVIKTNRIRRVTTLAVQSPKSKPKPDANEIMQKKGISIIPDPLVNFNTKINEKSKASPHKYTPSVKINIKKENLNSSKIQKRSESISMNSLNLNSTSLNSTTFQSKNSINKNSSPIKAHSPTKENSLFQKRIKKKNPTQITYKSKGINCNPNNNTNNSIKNKVANINSLDTFNLASPVIKKFKTTIKKVSVDESVSMSNNNLSMTLKRSPVKHNTANPQISIYNHNVSNELLSMFSNYYKCVKEKGGVRTGSISDNKKIQFTHTLSININPSEKNSISTTVPMTVKSTLTSAKNSFNLSMSKQNSIKTQDTPVKTVKTEYINTVNTTTSTRSYKKTISLLSKNSNINSPDSSRIDKIFKTQITQRTKTIVLKKK